MYNKKVMIESRIRIEKLVEEAIKRVILETTPERKDELEQLWSEYSPNFILYDDKPGFSMETVFGSVLFTNRTMQAVWILGFAAWKAFYCFAVPLLLLQTANQNFSVKAFNEFPDQSEAESLFANLINSMKELVNINRLDEFRWPSNIPKPYNGKPEDKEGSVIFDLTCMATAYIFLHEIQHLKFRQEGKIDLDSDDEEILCDEFARKMLLDDLDRYSKDSGYPLEKLKTKRAMSIALASFLLLVITPKQNWEGTRSHPSITHRIEKLTRSLLLPENDKFWIYLSCLTLAYLRYERCLLLEISFSSQKALCLKLIDQLERPR